MKFIWNLFFGKKEIKDVEIVETKKVDVSKIDDLLCLVYDEIEFNLARIRVYKRDLTIYANKESTDELINLIYETNRQNYQTYDLLTKIRKNVLELGRWTDGLEDMIDKMILERKPKNKI